MKKKYTLEDVQKASASLQTFVSEKLGKNVKTNKMIDEFAVLNYDVTNLIDAGSLYTQIRDIEHRHHAMVMAELKNMNNDTRWIGTYIIHDLICAMAHLGFTISYAIKDSGGEANGDSGQ